MTTFIINHLLLTMFYIIKRRRRIYCISLETFHSHIFFDNACSKTTLYLGLRVSRFWRNGVLSVQPVLCRRGRTDERGLSLGTFTDSQECPLYHIQRRSQGDGYQNWRYDTLVLIWGFQFHTSFNMDRESKYHHYQQKQQHYQQQQ